MSDFRTILANLRRPRLLMRAARFGLEDYSRDRDLRRLVRCQHTPDHTVPTLLDEEERLEQTRLRGDASYSVARHVSTCWWPFWPRHGSCRVPPWPESKRKGRSPAPFHTPVLTPQTKASGISSLRLATYAFSASWIPSSRLGCW